MRQIEVMAIAVAQLLFGKGGKEYDLTQELGQERSAELHGRLTALLREGRLNEAENLLFFQLDETDQGMLAAAVDFYRQANAMSDEELEAQDFTRAELWEGLGEVVERYGLFLPGFWDKPQSQPSRMPVLQDDRLPGPQPPVEAVPPVVGP